MSDSMPMSHRTEDGSSYGVEVVAPAGKAYGAGYSVDLVRSSTDHNGQERQQRLQLAQYPSWAEADEHRLEVETSLQQDGLQSLNEDIHRVAQMPYSDGQYLAVIFPTDASPGAGAKVYLLHLSSQQVSAALVAVGQTAEMQALVGQLDHAGAAGGNKNLLEIAHREAEQRGQISPGTALFDPVSRSDLPGDLPYSFGDDMRPFDAQGVGQFHHVDGGGTAHWFSVVAKQESAPEPYELRYFRALRMDDDTLRHDSYPVMPLPDDDPGSAWPLAGLEMYLEKGNVYMAQQLAYDVAEAYEQGFPDPLDLPALDPNPEYYFGYGVGPNNAPSLEAVKTWMDGAERRFDTLTLAEYDRFDEAAADERRLEQIMAEKGIEAAMNQVESMAVAGGYLKPDRNDPRLFFADDAPVDPFTTHRERELAEPAYTVGAVSANGETFLDVLKTWGKDDYERLVIPQPDWETAQDNAEVAGDMLEARQLQEAMRLVELAGIEAGIIDPERDDPRLFTQGPPDPFQTIRQAELEKTLLPDMDELASSYHRLDVRAAQSPEGQALGYAVIASAYPGLPADFDDAEMDDTRYPTSAWALDVAHFEAEADAQSFVADNRETVLPDLVRDAVGQWHTWDLHDINRFMAGRPQVIQPEDWQPQYEDHVLQPLDSNVNYAIVVKENHPESLALAVEKVWHNEQGENQTVSQTVQTYDTSERTQAMADRETLLEVYHERGLQAMMHRAELQAIRNSHLPSDRDNPLLFADGPPDRFETLAQRLADEINPYWNTDGETIFEPETAQNPYWRMETLHVNDPDGEPLGHALHMVVYPNIKHDPERVGTPAMVEDEPFRMLEMAHFETIEAADRFGIEFNSYLMPGLLEGPELAEEVARLEGLPVEWKTLEGDDLQAYQIGVLSLTRDPADWHLYNPNAERDARIEAEGFSGETFQPEPQVTGTTPDMDL